MKKILAGMGAVDYYLTQTRRGIADYYLPEHSDDSMDADRRPVAPGSAWWGGGATQLRLSGPVGRDEFVPLYSRGVRPDGTPLGRRFRLPEQAAASKAQASAAADALDDPYERWLTRHEIRRTGGQASVAAWDCTFSPVKSVSLLWAAAPPVMRRQVWAAHLAAVDAGLAYLEEHAAYVRAGRNGIRILETSGLVVARMNEWTSRDGDMQLHTHCVVLNRAQTLEDGRWRALDGRVLLEARTGAGAVYNRVLEVELTRRLGVGWRARPDGLRELEGVDDSLIETFSSRRRAITSRIAELAAAYEHKYGVPPAPAVLSRMSADAFVTTRRRKRAVAPEKALADWEATARQHGRLLAGLPAKVVGLNRQPRTRSGQPDSGEGLGGEVDAVIGRLAAGGRATFGRHDLVRAALDVLRTDTAGTAAELQERARRLADEVARHPALVGVSSPDLFDIPDGLCRSDGTSIYERPGRQRWSLRSTLDQEAWLLDVATEPSGMQVDRQLIGQVGRIHGLGGDQQQAVDELLTSDRRIGLLVGPAGAGKTRTLRAVVDAWQSVGRPVVGLTVSQAAAEVLDTQAQLRTDNIAKWLYETRRGRWQLSAGTLMIVDEASMVATGDLVDIVAQTRQAGGKVLLVGDPAQLAAIHIGGAFDLLATRTGTARLHEVRRFTNRWEANTSLQLRNRDPAALAGYAMRGRIHGDTLDQIETRLFDAWHTDALTAGGAAGRRSVIMVVATNEQAATLGERARHTLIAAGVVDDGPTVELADNLASVGDHIVTRRNDRRLVTSNRRWVVNGDLWTITHIHPDRAATVTRHADGATVTLPAGYLAAHAHVGYATTAHRAQGLTVDTCHALITAEVTHQQLYVAATRGRDANHLWVALDSDRDLIRDHVDLPAPEQILTRILERRDPDRLSAHQILEDSQTGISSLARLGAIYEDAARTTTAQWLADTLAGRGLADATADRHWSTLVVKIRQAALAGHNIPDLLDDAIGMRPIGGAHSIAGVLHWRLQRLTDTAPAVRPRGPLAALPPGDGPHAQVARQAGELIRQRWRQLRHTLRTAKVPEPVRALGPRPAAGEQLEAWLTAATPVAAYRERYEIADHTPLLGPRPSGTRPDVQAAWDHAQTQVDRYHARRLHHLDDQQLADLDTRQQHVIAARPRFDPTELDQAHHTLAQLTRQSATGPSGQRDVAQSAIQQARRRVEQLERRAQQHQRWRDAAHQAHAIRRQISLARQKRTQTVIVRGVDNYARCCSPTDGRWDHELRSHHRGG